jgi:hypothetical protein
MEDERRRPHVVYRLVDFGAALRAAFAWDDPDCLTSGEAGWASTTRYLRSCQNGIEWDAEL